MWITAATRAALPQNKTGYKKYSNRAITHPNLSLNAATYLGWLFTELGQQTGNIDIQVRSHQIRRHMKAPWNFSRTVSLSLSIYKASRCGWLSIGLPRKR